VKTRKLLNCQRTTLVWLLSFGLAGLITATVNAVPPSPELLEAATRASKISGVASTLPETDRLHERGICTPDNFFANYLQKRQSTASLAPTAGGFKILAILVKFSDHPSQVVPIFFDSLIFDSSGGSTIKKYFNEISNTQIDLITVNLPSALGWVTAPAPYTYYVNGNYGTALTPPNTQTLVENLVDQVDPQVNFADYDNDGNGYVDVLLVIHSGTGAEMSGNPNDIWSHKWGITPRLKDGVRISTYTVQPEFWTTPGDMTIGVYSHELCHGFGLPDLYDINSLNGNSYGAGNWCIMANGCWNGPSGRGGSPSHPCAWSRIHMGLASATVVASNLTATTITPVENGGTIYRLWTAGGAGNEHFLVENRQKTGYDSYLPASGLLIWHIDDGKNDNGSAWWPGQDPAQHYLVALEQADGLYQLEHATSVGNAADPFPGTGNVMTFSASSTPNSDSYQSGATSVAVTNITTSGSNIIADLMVGLAAGVDDGSGGLPEGFTLMQNYPNPFNPSTMIAFELTLATKVQLEIYNSVGQRVRTLFSGPADAGITQFSWDGNNDQNRAAASGVYLYKLTRNDGSESVKKMVLVR
jgi:immune inhibitor A